MRRSGTGMPDKWDDSSILLWVVRGREEEVKYWLVELNYQELHGMRW